MLQIFLSANTNRLCLHRPCMSLEEYLLVTDSRPLKDIANEMQDNRYPDNHLLLARHECTQGVGPHVHIQGDHTNTWSPSPLPAMGEMSILLNHHIHRHTEFSGMKSTHSLSGHTWQGPLIG
jgi:hypothetical protein